MTNDEMLALIEKSNKHAISLTKEWHSRAEYWSQIFFTIDNADLLKAFKENNDIPEFLCYLKEIYTNTVFYPSTELNDEYKALDINDNTLRWYTSIGDIFKLIPEVSSNGKFIVSVDLLLLNIKLYLDAKIWDTLLKDFGYVGKVYRRETNLSETGLHKYLLRSKARSRYPRSILDLDLEPLFAKISKTEFPHPKDQKDLKNIAGGNVESMLIGEIFHKFILPNPELPASETNIMEKCRSFFNLAKLVMTDEDLADEATFLSFRGKYSKYDGDYNDYKGKRIYKLFVG